MHSASAIDIETRLSVAMLNESIRNKTIRNILTEIAQILEVEVLNKIINIVEEEKEEYKSLSHLPASIQASLSHLANQQSSLEKQAGATFPDLPPEKIIESIDSIKLFLRSLKNNLQDVNKIDTHDKMLKFCKTTIDLSYCYVTFWKFLHREGFNHLESMLYPNQEEFDIRIPRTTMGQKTLFAISYGIGTEINKDLETSGTKGWKSGKSVFGSVNMEVFLNSLIDQVDKNSKLSGEIKAILKKLDYYKIPVLKEQRKHISEYAKRYKTTFEKLAEQTASPLIASASGTTSRLLITLQNLGFFTQRDNQFDFNKLQMISNWFMGFLVYLGHHSILEVAEIHNRFLDYIGIYHPGYLPKDVSTSVEKQLPYYLIGEYQSFFHKSYVQKIFLDAKLDTTILKFNLFAMPKPLFESTSHMQRLENKKGP